MNGIQIRCINGYGPQEKDPIERREKFWERIGLEIEDSFEKEKGVIFQMDGNLHDGPYLLPGDPNKCNANGKLFVELLMGKKKKQPWISL